jgi:hypothetical protein
MKQSNLLLLLGAGALTVYILSKKASAVNETPQTVGEAFPTTAAAFTAPANAANFAAAPSNYNAAFDKFVNASVNTPASISAGVNLINQAVSSGVQLPSLSRTIQDLGAAGRIAQLADGSTKLIKVQQPERDSSGMTALDRVIKFGHA